MSAPGSGPGRGGSGLTFGVAAVAVAVFGLVGGLPDLIGPALGVAGLAVASWWRRRPATGATFGPLPAVVALAVLAATSPAAPSTELFGGLAAVALLLWLADDPSRPAGGGRRAGFAVATCALAVGIAWSVALVLPRPSGAIGIAGGMLAALLLLVAYLLARATEGRSSVGATA